MLLDNCKSCGAENEIGSRFCIKCGISLDDPGKCSSCGASNPPEAGYCAGCGSKLGGIPPSESRKDISGIWSTPVTGANRRTGSNTVCRKCGGRVLTTDWLCPHCSCNLDGTTEELPRGDSSFPLAIGVILLIASILNIMNGIIVGSVASVVPAYGFCGIIEVLIGLVTFPGAIAAMTGKHYMPVFVVSLLTLFSVGPCFICSLLGLVAVIGLAAARKDFES